MHRRVQRPRDSLQRGQLGPEAVQLGEEDVRAAVDRGTAGGRLEPVADELHGRRARGRLALAKGEHPRDRGGLGAEDVR